jgi:hypothetical protein
MRKILKFGYRAALIVSLIAMMFGANQYGWKALFWIGIFGLIASIQLWFRDLITFRLKVKYDIKEVSK